MRALHDMIMDFAASMMPRNQFDWERAMRAEYDGLTDQREQLKFALGCLQVSLISAAQTRKGLSVIGRGLVALGLASFSFYGLLFMGSQFPASEFSALITPLCFYYAGAAVFTVVSLKGLRLYSSLGLAVAILSYTAFKITTFETADISNIYLQALSFEWAVFNTALIVAATYLSLINTKDEAAL